jgi:hypothetical protein
MRVTVLGEIISTGAELIGTNKAEAESGRKAPAPKAAAPLVGALTLQLLQPAIIESLYSAYHIRAYAHFILRNFPALESDARYLMALGPRQWEGYHWMALSMSESDSLTDRNLIEQCYLISVRRRPNVNKDNVNLAELYFFSGFYNSLSAFLVDDPSVVELSASKEAPARFREKMKRMMESNEFDRNYSPCVGWSGVGCLGGG